MDESIDQDAGRCLVSAEDVHRRLHAIVESNDPAAVAWLYETFAPKLLRRLRGRYAHPGGLDAGDLLQDAFVLFLRQNGKVLADFMERVPVTQQTAAALERLLWDLACGLATNLRRSASRVTLLSLFDSPRRSTDAGVEQRTIQRDLLEQLDGCLEVSGSRVYLYFTLRYRDGLTPDEIARATGWSKKATYKLRQALNEALARCAENLGWAAP